MAAWFRRNRSGSGGGETIGGADDSTGEIPAVGIAPPVAEGDGAAGTTLTGGASEPGVEPVAAASTAEIDFDTALADRQALIRLCLYAWDRSRSDGVTERIERGLADIGVLALRPVGQRFDPAMHEAGGTAPTEDSSLHGTIADIEVAGFHDHGALVRVPVVTVYTRRDDA